ncbi:hypothetical protein HAX54_050064 [Datura stramonium]|uniref:Uncharacterized protein n=1 Tax=Datura stramonium TaxID=4076 RepID=A0ABS8WL02_DATST|nr:hypothetical protein [Datura stramonium]
MNIGKYEFPRFLLQQRNLQTKVGCIRGRKHTHEKIVQNPLICSENQTKTSKVQNSPRSRQRIKLPITLVPNHNKESLDLDGEIINEIEACWIGSHGIIDLKPNNSKPLGVTKEGDKEWGKLYGSRRERRNRKIGPEVKRVGVRIEKKIALESEIFRLRKIGVVSLSKERFD